MADEQEVTRRIGQEGSRWYNAPPTGAEIASWFKENVKLAEGLEADNYVQGITMIPGVEKAQAVIGWSPDNKPIIERVENLVYTPYAKVETRIAYFHDLMAKKEDEWLGIIEPIVPEKQDPRLPPGFFAFSIATGPDTVVRYICCSMKVTVYERKGDIWKEVVNRQTGKVERIKVGKTIIDAPPATKQIALLGYQSRPDSFALMKAETGAIGRALGLAGMLVIPGSGVAPAEDLQEAQALEGRSPTAVEGDPEQAKVPEATGGGGEEASAKEELNELRQRAVLVVGTIKTEFPELFTTFLAWAKERKIGEIASVEDPRILRGIITKADRELAEAREAQKAATDDAPPPAEQPKAPEPQADAPKS
jgi:hypothetical protein